MEHFAKQRVLIFVGLKSKIAAAFGGWMNHGQVRRHIRLFYIYDVLLIWLICIPVTFFFF